MNKYVVTHIIPLVKRGENYLPRNIDDGTIKFEPKLYQSEIGSLLQFASAEDSGNEENVKMFVFEFCYSFLEVFNKCTQRFYPEFIWKQVRLEITDGMDSLNQFDYLFEFPFGIMYRTEILRIYTHFHIFWPNHLLNNRLVHNRNTAFSNLE